MFFWGRLETQLVDILHLKPNHFGDIFVLCLLRAMVDHLLKAMNTMLSIFTFFRVALRMDLAA